MELFLPLYSASAVAEGEEPNEKLVFGKQLVWFPLVLRSVLKENRLLLLNRAQTCISLNLLVTGALLCSELPNAQWGNHLSNPTQTAYADEIAMCL